MNIYIYDSLIHIISLSFFRIYLVIGHDIYIYISLYHYILLFLSLDAPILRHLRTLTSLLNGPEGSTEGSTAILVLL